MNTDLSNFDKRWWSLYSKPFYYCHSCTLVSKLCNHLYYSILTPKGASQAYHLTEVGFFKAPITEHLRVTELPAWAWMSGPPSILTTGTTIRIMGHSLIFKLAAGSSKWRRKGQEISKCKYVVVALPKIWTKIIVKFCPEYLGQNFSTFSFIFWTIFWPQVLQSGQFINFQACSRQQ